MTIIDLAQYKKQKELDRTKHLKGTDLNAPSKSEELPLPLVSPEYLANQERLAQQRKEHNEKVIRTEIKTNPKH